MQTPMRNSDEQGDDTESAEAAGQKTPGPNLGGAIAGSSGDLWGAVQPCWRKLGAGLSVPVALEVSLDSKGQIAVPPKIIRNGTPNEAVLLAEAKVLSALRQCLPKNGNFGGKVHLLQFTPSS